MSAKPTKRQQFTDLLNRMSEAEDNRQLLVELVGLIRPSNSSESAQANDNLDSLIALLKEKEELRQQLKQYIYTLFSGRNSVRAFTELGIQSSKGFFSETWRKISYEILPPSYPENGLMQDLFQIFRKKHDYKWVEAIATEKWAGLFELLGYEEPHELPPGSPALNQLLNCILVLSQRITAIGLEAEIVEKMPEIELFDSPFMVQSREISSYLEYFNDPEFERNTENNDYKHILVMLVQCEEYIKEIRRNKSKFGTSLSLSQSLLRLSQNLHRLRMFLKLVHYTEEDYPFKDEAVFFKQLIRAENKKHSLREHFNQNLSYLAFQITEHTGKKGKKYITSSRPEYWGMFRSALGGGFIVGFLTIFKTIVSNQALAPFGRAFLYSMNYSLGFILIHLTHSTLATKQPAMTASRVAATLDVSGEREKNMKNLVEMLVRLSRSQFIAFAGNIVLAFPVGFGIAWIIELITGARFADEPVAQKIIHELHPINSLALFHAAIAGFYLFLSGLISGYYDNLNIYSKIPKRLKEHRILQRIIPQKRLNAYADYIENNLGALAGNFFLGIFLGSTGVLGYILGLPLDIRHVTFASGNFGIAIASMDAPYATGMIIYSLLGIFLIGLVNFIVSFGLTTAMAMKSRNVDFRGTRLLIKLLLKRFIAYPLDFVWAPKQPHGELALEEESVKPVKDQDPTERKK